MIGAISQRDTLNIHKYLVHGQSHVFLTRKKFSMSGDFSPQKDPVKELTKIFNIDVPCRLLEILLILDNLIFCN